MFSICHDSDRFVCSVLMLGDLIAADTVFVYDLDWNRQNDIQAQARCHCIVQNCQ